MSGKLRVCVSGIVRASDQETSLAQVEALKYLSTVAKTTAQKMEVMVNLISAYFDVAPSMSTHLPVAIWRKTVGTLLQLLQLLKDNPDIVMDPEYDADADRDDEDDEPRAPAAPAKVRILFSCTHDLCYVVDGSSLASAIDDPMMAIALGTALPAPQRCGAWRMDRPRFHEDEPWRMEVMAPAFRSFMLH